MDELRLEAKKRDVLGKKTRFLRRQGITPTHVFGHGIKSASLQCDTSQLQNIISEAGMTKAIRLAVAEEKNPRSVFIKEVQKDTFGKQLLHVDFYQVRKGEKMRVEVPIVMVGEAPALKTKGRMLIHGVTSLPIESLPDKIPAEITVDISSLEEVETPINVGDLDLDPDITIHAEPDQLVVKVSETAVQEVEEEVPEEEEEAAEEGAEEGAAEEAPAEETAEEEK